MEILKITPKTYKSGRRVYTLSLRRSDGHITNRAVSDLDYPELHSDIRKQEIKAGGILSTEIIQKLFQIKRLNLTKI